MSSLLLMGSDPELFIEDRTGKVRSAIGLLGGTKGSPRPLPKLGKGFSVQEDNVLAEYNTRPTASSKDFINYQRAVREYLAEFFDKQGFVLSNKASHIMDDSELQSPMALVFGCEPDFNVWSLEMNAKPKAANPNLRSAGGHIHLGFQATYVEKIQMARLLDLTLGLWSVINDPDTRRRELYGKAGCVRFKEYGLEYRTLSNFWTMNSAVCEAVTDIIRLAATLFYDKRFVEEAHGEQIQRAINTSDVSLCKELLRCNGLTELA